MKTSFSGEVQLAGFSDSSRSGPRVTFRLADRADLESFVGLEGRRFMLAMVEVADDETPAVPQDELEPAPEPVVQPAKGVGPLCKWVAIRCGEEAFQRWLGVNDEAGARQAVLAICGIASRKQIDEDPRVGAIFHERIRLPFWEHEQAVAA